MEAVVDFQAAISNVNDEQDELVFVVGVDIEAGEEAGGCCGAIEQVS